MGSLGNKNEKEKKQMVVTQVSFGGFEEKVTAKELTHFLEDELGMIWRCRLKNSWTPPESYPNFEVTNTKDVQKKDDYQKVKPHAFVHFASHKAAIAAKNAAGRCELFYKLNPLMVNLGPESSLHTNHRRVKTDPFKFSDVLVQIGTLVSLSEFCACWKGPAFGVEFVVDPFDGTCKILFTKETAFSFKGISKQGQAVLKCDFKFEFLVREITDVRQGSDSSSLIILLQLNSSPHLFYRTADDDVYVSVPYDLLDDEDPWIRTTDFTNGVIGRSNTYRISMSPRCGPRLDKAMAYLKQRRVPFTTARTPKVLQESVVSTPANTFFCIPCKKDISFEIMYMVNAVVHKGIINQYQLSDRFFELLRSQPAEVNIKALNHMYCYKRSVFDAYRRLKVVQEWLVKNPKVVKSAKISDFNMAVNRLVITPTRAYCLPPEVELSNRVLRRYKDVADRFLRVSFMDEGFQQLNQNVCTYYVAPIVRDMTSNSFPQKTTIFKRVKTLLSDGFYLCGRKYSFLAFSSNQLRDRSAWFFAENADISVTSIISWMGKFKNKNIAKCSARMGQCFSSTYETVRAPSSEVDFDLPDIKRNNHVFSDGIGMMTPDLAAEIAEKLQLTETPSAFQIRYAGCKGVIASWPEKEEGIRLYLRESMNKFNSKHDIIEVVSWTRFQPGFLNRQIVTLLSALEVPNDVFSKMQDSMVYKLDHMLNDTDVALDVVISSCGEDGNAAALMLSAGFKPQTEPHLRGMLTCIRAAQQGDLLEKARIFVPSGRWLMGCLDELGLLEQGQCFIKLSSPSLEDCFVKHGFKVSEPSSNVKVITGNVVMAKNPCLHPGDVRILEAVDIPELHHLVDCLVFPQKGDRPHSDEASGSDLDGDLYFVTWDEDLIPPSKRSWPPMNYAAAEAKELPRPVNQQDIIDFFTRNMVTDQLGVICNAHVAHADKSEYGALDEKCLQLAELAATAVDSPKSGKLVTMPPSLKVKVYPDFMGKEDYMSYDSPKILGILYRRIKNAFQEDVPSASDLPPTDILYDADLEMPCSEDLLETAWNHKCAYDGQLNALMGQYKVNTEEEVVTGHVWSMPKSNSRKQREMKERLKHAYHALKKEFRKFFDIVDSDSQDMPGSDLKNKFYEQKASAWYQVTYHPKWVQKSLESRRIEEDDEIAPALLSFAWIPMEYLVRIKIRHLSTVDSGPHRSNSYLARCLASQE